MLPFLDMGIHFYCLGNWSIWDNMKFLEVQSSCFGLVKHILDNKPGRTLECIWFLWGYWAWAHNYNYNLQYILICSWLANEGSQDILHAYLNLLSSNCCNRSSPWTLHRCLSSKKALLDLKINVVSHLLPSENVIWNKWSSHELPLQSFKIFAIMWCLHD